jgi:hypothetical protein
MKASATGGNDSGFKSSYGLATISNGHPRLPRSIVDEIHSGIEWW